MSRYRYNQNQMRHASSAAIVPIATCPIDVVPISSMDPFMDTSRYSFHASRLNSPASLMTGFRSPLNPLGMPATAPTASRQHRRLIDMTLMYGFDVQCRVFIQQPAIATAPRYIDFMNVGTADSANVHESWNKGGQNFASHQQNLLSFGTFESRAPLAHFASVGVPKNDGVLGTFKGMESPIYLGRPSGTVMEPLALLESARDLGYYHASSNSNGTTSLTSLGGLRSPRDETSTFFESARALENYGPRSNFKGTTSQISLGGPKGPRNKPQVAWGSRYYGGTSSSKGTSTSPTSLSEPMVPTKERWSKGNQAAGSSSKHNTASSNTVANHICIECGDEFESGRALGGHKSSHTKKRQREEHKSRTRNWMLARMRAEAATSLANHMFENNANRRE